MTDSQTVTLLLELSESTAPRRLVDALQQVQVTRSDKAPSTFSLTFHTEQDGSNDFPLLAEPLLQPFSRVTLTTIVRGSPTILIDGYITQRQLTPAPGPAGTTLTVSGEDVSVKMNMIEISFDYPHMGDFLIVEAVLAKYLLFKIIPDAQISLADAVPFGFVPQQNGTDRVYLQELAQKHGYRFYMKPKSGFWNDAYWGPPELGATPQKALTVDMGPASNVDTIQFGENVLAPTMTYGMVPQNTLPPPVPQRIPVIAFASTRSPELAAEPVMESYGGALTELFTNPLGAMKTLLDLQVRGTLFQTTNLGPNQDQSLGILQALPTAQGLTNESTDEVVTVQGRLTTSRYGAVLEAPGVVEVRGAGYSCDGKYYVQQVQHSMDLRQGSWNYTQDFVLNRDGMGSTVTKVSPL